MQSGDDRIMAEVKAMPDYELARWAKLGKLGFKQVAAEQELLRRQWWRDFWTKGIIAWIALGLSLISLGIQIIQMKP